jgi:hypothetical protein
MAQTLKNRRMRARGFNVRQAALLGGRYFRGIGRRAKLTTALSGANNDITLLARRPDTTGNSITLTIVVSGASTPLSVSVSTSAITVNSATSAGSAATSTAKEVIKAINSHSAARRLVWAQRAAHNDGTGVVTALSSTSLSGAS